MVAVSTSERLKGFGGFRWLARPKKGNEGHGGMDFKSGVLTGDSFLPRPSIQIQCLPPLASRHEAILLLRAFLLFDGKGPWISGS